MFFQLEKYAWSVNMSSGGGGGGAGVKCRKRITSEKNMSNQENCVVEMPNKDLNSPMSGLPKLVSGLSDFDGVPK